MSLRTRVNEQDLPMELRYEFRDVIKTLSNARRAEAWDTLFKCVRWALAMQDTAGSISSGGKP